MPQRFLRPGLTTSKRFNRVSWAAQTFYTRLITLVDDYGRYEADHQLLRSHAFPYGDPDGKDVSLTTIANICEQLFASRLVFFYEAENGKKYLQLTKWQERARSNSKYPEPPCEQLLAFDNNCLPPSPSPTPSSSSSPTPKAIGPTSGPLKEFSEKLKTPRMMARWQQWMTHRRAFKAPKSWPTLFNEQIAFLERYDEPTAYGILDKSIRNGYQGLFEPSGRGGETSRPNPRNDGIVRGPTDYAAAAARKLARQDAAANPVLAGQVASPQADPPAGSQAGIPGI